TKQNLIQKENKMPAGFFLGGMEHHASLADCHKTIAAHLETTDPKLSKLHETIAGHHTQRAEHYSKLLGAEENRLLDDHTKAARPDGVRGVLPNARPTAVPRTDSPQLGKTS